MSDDDTQGRTKLWRLANVQRTAPSSAPSGGGGLPAWVSTHKRQAAIGGGVAAVAALALLRRRRAADGMSPGSAGSAAAPTTSGTAAGLVSPDTSASDIQNAVQDQLNPALSSIDEKLSSPTPATTVPSSSATIFRPGAGRYTIRNGDTLNKIATAVYGSTAANAVGSLKHANPVLWTFPATAALNFFAGQTIIVPAWSGSSSPAPAKVSGPVNPIQKPVGKGSTTKAPSKPSSVKRRA